MNSLKPIQKFDLLPLQGNAKIIAFLAEKHGMKVTKSGRIDDITDVDFQNWLRANHDISFCIFNKKLHFYIPRSELVLIKMQGV